MKYKILILVIFLGLAGLIFVKNYKDYSSKPLPNQDDNNSNLIVVETPKPNEKVSSPLTIKGKARGVWYFEASFPVVLKYGPNASDQVEVPATAQGEWMTQEFVPFTAVIEFSQPTASTGELILKKDNPSGLPENDASITIPIRFK